ncbi:YhgE/Pip family protein [Brachybacterium hainanense]|uniref:YhgE/Pip family protein n=1 Tax=Brachybacterium hainanense TaxID=1541174 RepID=A0ABV6R842_9MICO
MHPTKHPAPSFLARLLALIPAEWKKPIAALFVTGLAVVPIVYSGNMTWSFDDPSGNLNRMTAAVVNEDTGADVTAPDGEARHLDVGADFTETLLDMDKSTVYRFVEVDRADAEAGLADGTYGALVEIPEDFSANVGSLGGEDPGAAKGAVITVRTNDTVNYVSGNFTKSVGTAITEALRASVLEEYLDNVYVGFTTLHDGLGDAVDGAEQLTDGSGQLRDGAGDLEDGSRQLTDGAVQLHDGSGTLVVGLRQLLDGSVTLGEGADQLSEGARGLADGLGLLDANSSALRSGSSQLADGTRQVADGALALQEGADQVASGTQTLDDAVTSAQQRLDELGVDQESVDQASQDLTTGLDDVSRRLDDLETLLGDHATAADTLATGAEGLAGTATDIDDRATAMAEDATTLADDARALEETSQPLSEQATAVDTAVTDAQGPASDAADSAEGLSADVDDYTRTVEDLAARCAGSGAEEAFCADLAAVAGDSSGLRESASGTAGDARTASDGIDEAAQSSGALAGSATGIHDTASGMVPTAESLETGAQDVADLTGTMAAPVQQLATDARTLSDGVAAATQDATDASTAQDGLGTRADELIGQAREIAVALPGAYRTLSDGADGVHQLRDGTAQLADGTATLADGSQRTADGASDLEDGITTYTDGVGSASSGADQLADGAGTLADGTGTLTDGLDQSVGGAEQIEDGSGQLVDGGEQLVDGSGQLKDGAGKLVDGGEELGDGLTDARDSVPSYTDGERTHLSGTASEAVSMDFVRDNGLNRFGEGLVPLFLAISLWVGGMAIFLMMPPFSERAAARGAGPLSLLAGGLVPALLLGAVQAVIAVAILQAGVGITAVDVPMLVLLSILTSLVFVALNHGFGALFGPVGKFVALVLIALQISGAGGTYPVQTLPEFFQVIHPYLPMTHAVDAFRGAIGGGWIDPRGDLTWLAGWLVLGIGLGLLGAVKLRRETLREAAAGTAAASGEELPPAAEEAGADEEAEADESEDDAAGTDPGSDDDAGDARDADEGSGAAAPSEEPSAKDS